MTGPFNKKADFVTTFNKKIEAKETFVPRGPSGPKKGQKTMFLLIVLAVLILLVLGGYKFYQVGPFLLRKQIKSKKLTRMLSV